MNSSQAYSVNKAELSLKAVNWCHLSLQRETHLPGQAKLRTIPNSRKHLAGVSEKDDFSWGLPSGIWSDTNPVELTQWPTLQRCFLQHILKCTRIKHNCFIQVWIRSRCLCLGGKGCEGSRRGASQVFQGSVKVCLDGGCQPEIGVLEWTTSSSDH